MDAETTSDNELPPVLQPVSLCVKTDESNYNNYSEPTDITNSSQQSPPDSLSSGQQSLSPTSCEKLINEVIDEFEAANNANGRQKRRAPRRNCAERIPLDSVVRKLTDPNVGSFPQGISPSQLDEYINTLPENQRVTRSRNHLHVLLWRETKFGKIRRLTTGKNLSFPRKSIIFPMK